MADAKKLAALIVDLKKESKENPHASVSKPSIFDVLGDSEAEESDAGSKGAEAAAKAFFKAGSSGDWSAAAKALQDLHYLHCDACEDGSVEDESIYETPVEGLSLEDDE